MSRTSWIAAFGILGVLILIGWSSIACAQSLPSPETLQAVTADLFAELEKHPLARGEDISITTLLESVDLSALLFQVRGALPPHFHRLTQEIVYLLRGQGVFELGMEKVSVQAGAVLRVPAGMVHTFTAQGGTAVFLVVTTPRWDIRDRFPATELSR